jgi:hypothetical protein
MALRGLRSVPNAEVPTYIGRKKIGAMLEEEAEEEVEEVSADPRKKARCEDA